MKCWEEMTRKKERKSEMWSWERKEMTRKKEKCEERGEMFWRRKKCEEKFHEEKMWKKKC